MDKNIKTILFDISLLIIFIISLTFLHQTHISAFLMAIGVTILSFMYTHNREDIVFFLTGLFFGITAEIFGAYSGAWTYTPHFVLGIPSWLPFAWSFGFLALRRIRDAVFKLSHTKVHFTRHPDSPKLIIFVDILIYVASLISIMLFWSRPVVLTIILGIIFLAALSKYHSVSDVFLIVGTIVILTMVDIMFTKLGAWHYNMPQFLGTTYWLFFAYGIIALVVRRVSLEITSTYLK